MSEPEIAALARAYPGPWHIVWEGWTDDHDQPYGPGPHTALGIATRDGRMLPLPPELAHDPVAALDALNRLPIPGSYAAKRQELIVSIDALDASLRQTPWYGWPLAWLIRRRLARVRRWLDAQNVNPSLAELRALRRKIAGEQ